MLIIGMIAVLILWLAFIRFVDPDGLREPAARAARRREPAGPPEPGE